MAKPRTTNAATPKRSQAGARPVADDNPNRAAVMVRMEPALLEGLDAWVAKLNAKNDGPRWTRSDVMRALLKRGVSERGEKGEAP